MIVLRTGTGPLSNRPTVGANPGILACGPVRAELLSLGSRTLEAMKKVRPDKLEHIAAELRPLARPVRDLQEDAKNARLHGEDNRAAIVASLRAHGQRKPIVVKDGVVI